MNETEADSLTLFESLTVDDFKGSVRDFLYQAPIFQHLAWEMGLNGVTDDVSRLFRYHERLASWPLKRGELVPEGDCTSIQCGGGWSNEAWR